MIRLHRHRRQSHPGYIFLISVLVVGAIAATTAITLILLGLASETSGFDLAQSVQALELAQTCAERTLRTLKQDLTYAGNETVTLSGGTFSVRPIGGAGYENRTICCQATTGRSTRRLEVQVRSLFPIPRIFSWKEVSTFSCP